MSEKMGVDSTTVGNWETGKRQMTLEKLMFMSEVTGFTVQYGEAFVSLFQQPTICPVIQSPPKYLGFPHCQD